MTARRTFSAFVLIVLALFAANTAYAVSTTVVISQVYGAGGNTGATLRNDYIELFNRGNTPQSLNGWSVQYASATGTGFFSANVTNLTNVTLQPGQYYLVQESSGGTNGALLPAADAIGTIAMAAGAGKVILANTTTGLACNGSVGQPCSAAQLAQIVDLVGYGTANFFEGAAAAPTLTATTSAFRALNGCTDTDNNSADFATGTPAARNTATTLAPCGVTLPNLTINDVSLNEGNAGTTSFTFTVSLSAPAGAGGVTFDIATADGTAQDDNPVAEDNDYVAKSLLAQTIPSGSSTYSFTVLVNGDVVPEVNETFFVNVTNVTGATVTDGQGQGTITNDDVSCANLSINDVTQVETDAGTTTFAFTVSLSQVGCGTVTFDIATADGTAQDDNPVAEDNDYVAQSLTGQTITFPSTYTFNVTVNGDLTTEPDQTFFVNITNVSPANVTVSDGQGLGTIVNDDYTRIHDIQGPGNSSPLSGSVTTRGIVTGRRSNGFFLQEPDATVDANPMTSEGILIFTSSAPPAAAAVGNYVEVTGTISEFVPSADLLQPPVTELTSPTVVQLTTGNPLPAPIPLTAGFPSPSGGFDQLERLEGMRVSVASLTTSSPTLGNSTNEPNATQTSNGVFFGTVTGVARPAREPGIQDPDPAPSGGSIPPIPRFDANPEMIRVDSDGLVGAPILDVNSLATVTGLVGPLDYTFRHYTILPDPTLPAPVAVGGMTSTAAAAATGKEFTVAGYNVERFFDTTNNPAIGEPILTATAYNNRLNKLSIGIRNNLLMPDIIGMVEVEDLATLTDIANRVNSDAVAASQPNPMYAAYLVEGNDIGGIDVGFLVKTAIVTGATPRVTVNAVVQENAGELFVNADSSTELLNDRPTLRLDAVVNAANGASFPVQVLVNHLRSLIGVNDESAGSSGWPTVGARVRAKRQKQAESLANLVQLRQTNNPAEHIILVGDFNAYEFNDGLADTMETIAGTPPPDNQTAVLGDGADLVNPDLDNLFDTPPAGQRYSYVFDGQTQNIDHEIVNAALIAATTARRVEHPRINTDFQAVDRNDPNTARHLSDHDPIVGFFEVNAFASADVSMSKTLDTAGPYFVGQSVSYTLTVANAGPDAATNIQVTDTPTNLSITGVSGSGCSLLPCTIASLASGANTSITVTATITAVGAFDNSADANAAEADPNTANNTDNTGNGGTAAASADVSITKTLDTAGPYFAGQSVTYTITVANAGPSTATNVSVTDTPSNLAITGVSGACTSFSPCTIASIASGGNAVITVTATINAAGAFDNSASATATENDPNGGNNTDNDGGTAAASADVSITKTLDTGGPYAIGQSVTYTITVANGGPSTATSIGVTDTPTNLTITNVSGACASFSPCTIASLASGANTTITVTATIDSSGQFVNAATAGAAEADPNTNNNSASASAVASQTNVVDVTKAVSGTFVQGTNVTYTIVMTNNMTVNQPDNFGHEFTDILPAGLTLVPASFTATSGTNGSVANIFFWDGSIPSGGTVTLTFQATISPTATGQICNQGQSIFDKDGDAQNESSELTDDPSTGPANDPTCFYVVQANVVEVTKAVSGTFVQGTNVTYTIVMTNNMTVTQPDNFGHEFTDILPAGLTLVPASFTATSGTNGSVSNIFFWDGSIPSGGTVTLTFQATISPTAAGQICNQGQSIFDRNGDGQNEAEEKTDDPSTAANNDFTCFYVVQANVVEVTKAVSGTFVQGTNVTYTIVMTNNMTVTQPDNFGHEFTDNLPAGLTLVPASFTATSGTNGSVANIFFWDGSIPSGGTVTLTFQATIGASATGTICNQGQSIFDRNGDGQNEAEEKTDDPSTGANNDPTCFTVIPTGAVSATKSVSGTFTQGSNITYTIVVTNNMGITQPDNAGNELTDVLPASLTLVSANATSGTAAASVGTNTVTWNGALAPGASTTITINATIMNTATGTVSNQATLAFDADGNGSNESSGVSDDPSTGAANDPTSFTVTVATGDTDGDGVLDAIEQAAPNGGDGNGDNIPDYLQGTVASIPAATGSGYLTLQSSCPLQQVSVTTEPTPDPGFHYPHGLIAFRAPCSSATFSLFVYGSGAVSAYRKFGPLPPGGPQQWYGLPGATFSTATVGSLHPRRVDFSLTDGGTGDDTPVDGVIVDQGGPSQPADVPTLDEWALMALAVMLAMLALAVMKK